MPQLSVIIASINGLPTIGECLAALQNQKGTIEAEIIVVDFTLDETRDFIQRNYPQVKLIKLPARLGIPEMRAIGMQQASGEYLIVTEDHCIAPENWFAEIVKAHASGYQVVGGTVENASRTRLVDWAVFFCEYSSLMPPIARGETQFVAGNNASYDRRLLEQIDESTKSDYWEYFLQTELKQRGIKFLSAPEILVNHQKEFGFFYFLAQRFYYSRSFAAMRRQKSSLSKQIIYLLYMPVLPFHLTARIVGNVLRKKRNQRELWLSLPMLLIFMLSYAAGEFVGQLFGAGDSLLKVE